MNNVKYLPLKGNEHLTKSPFAYRISSSHLSKHFSVNVEYKTITFLGASSFVEKLIGAKFPYRKVACVYQIGDYYVGSSKHVKQRIKKHIQDAINDRSVNKDLAEKIVADIVADNKISVRLYEGGLVEEYEIIREKIALGLPLTNKKTTL